jgi:MoCo/4Fe-4S cofactor protein with predicted Tat translocation signal
VNEPTHKPVYWRSLQDLERADEFVQQHQHEFPDGTFDADATPANSTLNRRDFLGVMGASVALASGAALQGCVRKEQQHVLPYADRPELLVPGTPSYFRTSFHVGGFVQGLHVESQDLRPTKVEGNPDHPINNPPAPASLRDPRRQQHRVGASSVWAQSSILDLYDLDRSQKPSTQGADASWDGVAEALKALTTATASGTPLSIVLGACPSPTIERLLSLISSGRPNVHLFSHDLASNEAEAAALSALLSPNHKLLYNVEKAASILAIDADFLGSEGDMVRNARLFADGRRDPERGTMNRLYFAGPALNVTSAMADEHLRIAASQAGLFLAAVAKALPSIPAHITAAIQNLPAPSLPNGKEAWPQEVAADLRANNGKSLILIGHRQPAWVHALGLMLNQALGSFGSSAHLIDHGANKPPTIKPLRDLTADQAKNLLIIGQNPAHTSPGFAALLKGATLSIHLSAYRDETSALCTWHIPRSHFLESWCDWRATDGTVSIQQPLIAPFFNTLSDVELLSAIANPTPEATLPISDVAARDYGFSTVRATWAAANIDEERWRAALFKGFFLMGDTSDLRNGAVTPKPFAKTDTGPNWQWANAAPLFAAFKAPAEVSSAALEVNFALSPAICDGRFANNAWLQELPDPISKLTWDNAAYLSPATAKALDVNSRPRGRDHVGDLVTLSANGQSCDIAVMVIPGMADNVVIVHLGYGRDPQHAGKVAKPTDASGTHGGTDVFPLRDPQNPWFSTGATLSPKGAVYTLATTQDHWHLDTGFKRPIIQEFRIDEENLFNPKSAEDKAHSELTNLKNESYQSLLFGKSLLINDKQSTFRDRTHNGKRGGAIVQQWGMVIDLNTCTGCNVCIIACQAENNIPVVGKDRVLNGREMHWMRIDRYYRGATPENPDTIVVQPMACAHCEMAPCETVCPVAATVHSPEGTNDMVYNRCIGTRYCSNNCPYKVRRYNFFNYQKENEEANRLAKMQKNPDVSIRFRGVMEKCTYCIQRVMQAKIEFKRAGQGYVPDGGVIMACAQACPSNAIIFGDIEDTTSGSSEQSKGSLVRELKSLFRNYAVLAELNNHPRTTYLARLRNRNPVLTPKPKDDDHHGAH